MSSGSWIAGLGNGFRPSREFPKLGPIMFFEVCKGHPRVWTCSKKLPDAATSTSIASRADSKVCG